MTGGKKGSWAAGCAVVTWCRVGWGLVACAEVLAPSVGRVGNAEVE